MSDSLRVMNYEQWAIGNAMGDKMIRRYAEQRECDRKRQERWEDGVCILFFVDTATMTFCFLSLALYSSTEQQQK